MLTGTTGTDVNPQDTTLVGVFESRNPATGSDEVLVIQDIRLGPGTNRFVLKNVSGQTMSLELQMDIKNRAGVWRRVDGRDSFGIFSGGVRIMATKSEKLTELSNKVQRVGDRTLVENRTETAEDGSTYEVNVYDVVVYRELEDGRIQKATQQLLVFDEGTSDELAHLGANRQEDHSVPQWRQDVQDEIQSQIDGGSILKGQIDLIDNDLELSEVKAWMDATPVTTNKYFVWRDTSGTLQIRQMA